MTDGEHPPEPFVPTPANNPEDGPKPGEGPDDTPEDVVHETPTSDEEMPPTERADRA